MDCCGSAAYILVLSSFSFLENDSLATLKTLCCVDQNNQEQLTEFSRAEFLASISELDRFLESRTLARGELLRALLSLYVF
jgi:hypothetical protein